MKGREKSHAQKDTGNLQICEITMAAVQLHRYWFGI
jgi:hypothetical protein